MSTSPPDRQLARDYVLGVRSLFAPPARPGDERSGPGPASPVQLAEQGEQLVTVSSELTRALAAEIEAADPAERADASTRLLAKALTDLEVSALLFEAAQDEEDDLPWSGGGGTERSVAGAGAIEERLRIILGEPGDEAGRVERGVTPPGDLPSARTQLNDQIEDALSLITKRAHSAGKEAIGGVFALGLAELGQAVAAVGMDVAQLLGQAEKATRLYDLFRGFATNAYASLIGLLGPELSRVAANRIQELFDRVRQGEDLARLLEALYDTEQTRRELDGLVQQSSADLARYTAAITAVAGLDAAYRQQISLSEKLLKGLRFLAMVPASALPQARLLVGAAYLVLGAYVVLTGADYVDARRLKLLDRVAGVRLVVETKLSDE